MKLALPTVHLTVTLALIFGLALPSFAGAKSEINKNWRGLAIKGYDPVAYFKDGKPTKGTGEYQFEWKGAKWRFASAEHRELFEADPEKYAPRYGGYCAWAVSEGYTAGVDPQDAWSIVDGKLYLNYDAKIKEKWEKDIPGHINKADTNWPGVLE